ncbi:MAG: SurA N-terminal domain-containing protein, partial [bacterium]|nr:SurA N-terminal domain-containing protein [bacterium]
NSLRRNIETLRQNNIELNEERMKILKQEVIQNLIASEAFYQEAIREGLEITDREVVMYVKSNPAFQVDGTFNPKIYESRLRMIYFTPKDFENEIRKSLSNMRLNAVLRIGIFPTQDAVELIKEQTKENDINKLTQLAYNEILASVNNIWLMRLNERVRIKTTKLYKEIIK